MNHQLSLASIRLDGGTQPRAATDFDVVAEYAHALAEGAAFPAVVVFFDGTDYWLADGFHRWHAHKAASVELIEADVRQGSVRDAILHSVGVNAAHGMRRTNADKRRAVTRLLDDAEWMKWSDREIARRCGVSQPFVGGLRPAKPVHTDNGYQYESRTFVHPKTGNETQMRTGSIGSNPAPRPASPPPPKPASEVERLKGLGASDERARQIAEDNRNGFISSAVWEIERQMRELPFDGREAARRFPVGHRHTIDPEAIRRFAAWFSDFAEEFEQTQEVTNVAAQ